MITTALLGVLFPAILTAAQSGPEKTWPEAMAAAVPKIVAKGPTTGEHHKLQERPAREGIIIYGGAPTRGKGAILPEEGSRYDPIISAKADLRAGKVKEAVHKLEAVVKSEPESPACIPLLADCYFRLGRYNDAFLALAPHVVGSDSKTQSRASFAAAQLGRVYQGQRAYVLGVVDSYSGWITGDDPAVFPRSSSGKAVAAISALAAGLEAYSTGDFFTAEYYLDQTLQLDKGNPLAAIRLSKIYRLEQKFDLALRTATSGESRATGRLAEIIKLEKAMSGHKGK